MKPRITLITLGVSDLERSLKFYRDGLGWPSEGIIGQEYEYGATAFFNLGTNGRWRAQLSEAQLRRHEQLTAERLPEDAALWLEHGSLALGQRA